MGLAYCELLRDRTRLMMQMQSYAACHDPEVRALVQRHYGALMRFVEDISARTPSRFGPGSRPACCCNVAAAMDLSSLGEEWPKRLLGEMLEKW